MRIRVLLRSGLPVAIVCLLGCTTRKLDPSGSGTLVPDGGGGADAAGGGASPTGAGGGATAGAGGSDAVGARLALGRRCTLPTECASGFCADGFCCNTACTDACWSCSQEVSAGFCLLLGTGAPPKTPNACPASEPSTCGYDGTCDGDGACRFHRPGTACAPGVCSGSTEVIGQKVCNGRGTCASGPTIICVPNTCDPATGACRSGCVTDADCAGTPCVDGRCSTNPEPAPCSRNDQCLSGFCADGVCCDTACNGNCMSCDVLGRQGTCWPRPDLCPGADAGSG